MNAHYRRFKLSGVMLGLALDIVLRICESAALLVNRATEECHMSMHWKRIRSRHLLFVLLVTLISTGCIRERISQLRGPGFDESSKRMTAEIPEREEAGRPYGFSSKAQEIESNFGFR